MSESPPPSPDHIMQIGMAFWASKTLLSAVELEVFTELALDAGVTPLAWDARLEAAAWRLHPKSAVPGLLMTAESRMIDAAGNVRNASFTAATR